jgi:hypothetical protein
MGCYGPSDKVEVEFLGIRLLLAADITEIGWSSLVSRMSLSGEDVLAALKSRIVKIPHHGGAWQDVNNMRKMFSVLQPEYVIISTGSKNIYDHPSKMIFDALSGVSSLRHILCTQATPHRYGLEGVENSACADSIEIAIKKMTSVYFPIKRTTWLVLKLRS